MAVVLTLNQYRDTKWSGTLFNSVSERDAEKVCEVTIQDYTPARGGLKLDLFLQKSDSIRLKKFHDLTDLDLLLPSFQHIAQFASLVPREENDKEAFAAMQEYLLLKEKVRASPRANDVHTDCLSSPIAPSLLSTRFKWKLTLPHTCSSLP